MRVVRRMHVSTTKTNGVKLVTWFNYTDQVDVTPGQTDQVALADIAGVIDTEPQDDC